MLTRRQPAKRKGQALVEYAILICGIALVSLVSVAILGHKTAEMLGVMAVILPSGDPDENGPIVTGKIIETSASGPNGAIGLDVQGILNNSGTDRLGKNIGANTQVGGNLIIDSN